MSYQSETSRHRGRLLPFCKGNGLDLGSGGDPIRPTAIQVELPIQYTPNLGQYPVQLRGDARSLYWFRDDVLDYVYSSHLLEDFPLAEWPTILAEWIRVIRPGGYLVLLVPDHELFQAAIAKGQPPNLAHQHEPYVGELTREVEKLGGMRILVDELADPDSTDYNLIFVAKKEAR